MERKNQKNKGVGEDKTEYGEFVSSFFAWIPIEKQKEKAEELASKTKEEENK